MMPIIEVRSKADVAERDIRQFAERRISFALDHLRNVRRVDISLDDVNGPKGGADKHCLICAVFGFTSIVMEETQPDWQIAVARAIHRLDRTATQQLQQIKRTTSLRAHKLSGRTSGPKEAIWE